MTQHTLGPWLVGRKIGLQIPVWSGAMDGLKLNVAHVTGIRGGEGEFNARLISAAPEMLEALQYAQAVVQKQLTTRTKQEYCIDKISAAIAKATGLSAGQV